jgi:hypothetical protein
MRPKEFAQQNAVFGAGQKEYQPLPAHLSGDGQVVSCWELSAEDIERVKETGCVWLSVLTFREPLQPVCLMTENPFGDESE